jgi:hypothetical protein
MGFGEYGFVEWRPLEDAAPEECEPAGEKQPASGEATDRDIVPVLMRALAPFSEARTAVVRALREWAGMKPLEELWSG